MSRDILAATSRLMHADDADLEQIVKHDPDMIRDVAANANLTQPAPPEGEPDFEKEAAGFVSVYDTPGGIIHDARTMDGLRAFTCELTNRLRDAYRLGQASRPKVEDGEIEHAVKMLRDDVQAYHEIADLLERLAGERDGFYNDAVRDRSRLRATESKLAEREAELAKAWDEVKRLHRHLAKYTGDA